MKGRDNLASKAPGELSQFISSEASLSLSEFYIKIEPIMSQLASAQLVELLHYYTKANLYNDHFLGQWSKAFAKSKDITVSRVVDAVKNLVTLKYNSNKNIIKTLQRITVNNLASFKIEQVIEVLHSFAKLQPFKEMVKLPSDRLIEIKEFITKIVERIKTDFDSRNFSASALSKIIFALAKLEFKDNQLLAQWTETVLTRINEFDTCDLVKNVESVALLGLDNLDLLLAMVKRSQDLLQRSAFSNEQKIIEAFYLSMLFVNNKAALTETNIGNLLKDHVAALLYNVNHNALETRYEQQEIIFALDNLDLIKEKQFLATKFTPTIINTWLQNIKANIHNEVTITESQQKLIYSLNKLQKAGLDITIEAEQLIVDSLGPVDIVIHFNYMEGSPPLIIQDDGLAHYRLSNHEEVTAKTQANTNILHAHGINFIRLNSYLKSHSEIFSEVIERFPKLSYDHAEKEPTISRAIEKVSVRKPVNKSLPKHHEQKKLPEVKEDFEEIIAKFKNENPQLYVAQKNEEDQKFLRFLAQCHKRYLFKAIEAQDYEFIYASIKRYKKEKSSIKERKEVGETIYQQLIKTLDDVDTFNQGKIQRMQYLTMYDAYNLLNAEQHMPLNDLKIAAGIKINNLLIKDLWLEVEQYIKDKHANEVITPIISYAILARNNQLLVTIIDTMIKHNEGKEANSIFQTLVVPLLSNTIIYNNFAALEYLLTKFKIDVNKAIHNQSTLLYAASYMLNVDAVHYLLDKMNAQPNLLSYHEEIGYVSPLYGSVLGYIHKFDPEMTGAAEGIPPFEETAAGSIARSLLKAGANTNFEVDAHFIFLAIQTNAISIVKHAIDTGEIDINQEYQSFENLRTTPKKFAHYIGRNEIFDFMLKGPDDVTVPPLEYVTIEVPALEDDEELPPLVDEEGVVVGSSGNIPEVSRQTGGTEGEEQQVGNHPTCLVCTAMIDTINPAAQNLFGQIFGKSSSVDLILNEQLNFNIFANQNKGPSASTAIQDIVTERSNININHNDWLNDYEIKKLLFSIGPINHRKINQLIEKKGGQPIKAIKYIYNLPDGGKGEYTENFLEKTQHTSFVTSTYFDELKSLLKNLQFNPTEPIHIDEIISHNSYDVRSSTMLIFDEEGFRIVTDSEQEFKTEPTVLSDFKTIENNLYPDLFYEFAPLENIAITNEWCYTSIISLCVLMVMGMQSSSFIFE